MTRPICVGGVTIGGGAPVVIQSMLNTKTTDVEGSLAQLRKLAAAGCQIARLAVPNQEAAKTFGEICKASPLPLVADIHFDYKLALLAAEGGASKIRINPGNIGGEEKVQAVVAACKEKGIPLYVTALSDRAVDLRDADLSKAAMVIGSEGRGVGAYFLNNADRELIIPMSSRCESLNAAIAAAIVMWEMKR